MVKNGFKFNVSLPSDNNGSISQNDNYSYLWQNLLLHPHRIKFSLIPVAVLPWKFFGGVFLISFAYVGNKIGGNMTLKKIRNELSYLANQFCMKTQHFRELPCTVKKAQLSRGWHVMVSNGTI